MGYESTRSEIKSSILDYARKDPRIVAVLDYGSTSEGRGDEWSDLDLAVLATYLIRPQVQQLSTPLNSPDWVAILPDLLNPGYRVNND